MIIGVTGGSGCGKTTFLRAAQAQGALVLDCDAIYHKLLQTSKDMLAKIDERFPGTVADGVLNRKALGEIVFSDAAALADLNTITHSFVRREVMQALSSHKGDAVIDAIGLFEGGLSQLCDCTVAITAPEEMQISRLMVRDNISREYALSRIRAQKRPEEFMALCDFVLENSGTEKEFQEQCLAFFKKSDMIKENS